MGSFVQNQFPAQCQVLLKTPGIQQTEIPAIPQRGQAKPVANDCKTRYGEKEGRDSKCLGDAFSNRCGRKLSLEREGARERLKELGGQAGVWQGTGWQTEGAAGKGGVQQESQGSH